METEHSNYETTEVRMRKIIWALVLTVALGACDDDGFTEVGATFAIHNQSYEEVAFFVDGQEMGVIRPQSAERFIVPILVPHSRRNRSFEPVVDREVDVSVSFKNLVTDEVSRYRICRAGAKIVTSVSYESVAFASRVYYDVRCTSSR